MGGGANDEPRKRRCRRQIPKVKIGMRRDSISVNSRYSPTLFGNFRQNIPAKAEQFLVARNERDFHVASAVWFAEKVNPDQPLMITLGQGFRIAYRGLKSSPKFQAEVLPLGIDYCERVMGRNSENAWILAVLDIPVWD